MVFKAVSWVFPCVNRERSDDGDTSIIFENLSSTALLLTLYWYPLPVNYLVLGIKVTIPR